jgi:hypothetical protein
MQTYLTGGANAESSVKASLGCHFYWADGDNSKPSKKETILKEGFMCLGSYKGL